MSLCIAKYLADLDRSSTIVCPTNPLVYQTLERYPDIPSLHKKSSYKCDKWGTCSAGHKAQQFHCKGCPYTKALREAKKSNYRIMNYYTYWAHRMYGHTLIVDEAHKLLDMLGDKQDITLWHSDYEFPTEMRVVADVVDWIERRLRKQHDDRLATALFELLKMNRTQAVEYLEAEHKGKLDIAIKVYPISSQDVPPWLWPPTKVRKLVFFTATMSMEDIKDLGLDRRRVKFIHCDSPIPVENRPVVFEPYVSVSRAASDYCVPKLAERLQRILDENPQKGLIHAPYSLVELLRGHLSSDRLLFHDRDNKQAMLNKFRNSATSEGKVLVASGLYEGIDLPYDLARWQVICKVPFLSLASTRVVEKMKHRPDWYDWSAIRLIVQASGRISRAADDHGVTYLFDANFQRLLDKDVEREVPLIPGHFSAALQINKL